MLPACCSAWQALALCQRLDHHHQALGSLSPAEVLAREHWEDSVCSELAPGYGAPPLQSSTLHHPCVPLSSEVHMDLLSACGCFLLGVTAPGCARAHNAHHPGKALCKHRGGKSIGIQNYLRGEKRRQQ